MAEVAHLRLDRPVQVFGVGGEVVPGLGQRRRLLLQTVLHLVSDAVGVLRDRFEQVDLGFQLARHGFDVAEGFLGSLAQVAGFALEHLAGADGGFFGLGLGCVEQFQPGPDGVDLVVDA